MAIWFTQVGDVQGSFVDGQTSRQLVVLLDSGKTIAYDYQSVHDAQLFRYSLACLGCPSGLLIAGQQG